MQVFGVLCHAASYLAYLAVPLRQIDLFIIKLLNLKLSISGQLILKVERPMVIFKNLGWEAFK